jgi:hypothetical protein
MGLLSHQRLILNTHVTHVSRHRGAVSVHILANPNEQLQESMDICTIDVLHECEICHKSVDHILQCSYICDYPCMYILLRLSMSMYTRLCFVMAGILRWSRAVPRQRRWCQHVGHWHRENWHFWRSKIVFLVGVYHQQYIKQRFSHWLFVIFKWDLSINRRRVTMGYNELYITTNIRMICGCVWRKKWYIGIPSEWQCYFKPETLRLCSRYRYLCLVELKPMYELVWTQHTGGHASNSTVGGKSREMFWTTHCSDDAFPRDCTVHFCDLWNAKCLLATCLITVVDLSTHTNGDACLLPANSAVFKTLWIVDWWLWWLWL